MMAIPPEQNPDDIEYWDILYRKDKKQFHEKRLHSTNPHRRDVADYVIERYRDSENATLLWLVKLTLLVAIVTSAFAFLSMYFSSK